MADSNHELATRTVAGSSRASAAPGSEQHGESPATQSATQERPRAELAADDPADPGDPAEPGESAGVEPDRPPTRALFGILFALSAVVVGSGLVLWQIFGLTSWEEIEQKDLRVENQELLELQARDWGRLTQYEALDGGVYQVPIERAMETLVKNPERIAPLGIPGAPEAGVGASGSEEGGAGDAGGAEEGGEADRAPAASKSHVASSVSGATSAARPATRTPPTAKSPATK